MICKLEDPKKAKELFSGREDTMILSCFQNIMGQIIVDDEKNPKSAEAILGCFRFFAGEPSEELIKHDSGFFAILVPPDERWQRLIENCFKSSCQKHVRYAIKKCTRFDAVKLKHFADCLPQGCCLHDIDSELYDSCISQAWSRDFVSNFSSREHFLEYGLGVVAVRNGEVVSGASSYSRYREGIEIEVDTREDCRRNHLARACSAALILKCLEKGLYPSWDAHNVASLHLAEKLGYEFSHEYTVYEINSDNTAGSYVMH